MKKLFTSLTALALVSAMVVPFTAFADNNTFNSGSAGQETTVTRSVDASYTVTIPASVTYDTSFDITATDLNIGSKTVSVFVAGNDGWAWKMGNSATNYRFKMVNTDDTSNQEFSQSFDSDAGAVCTFQQGGNSNTSSWKFVDDGDSPTDYGEYTGSVVFAVSCE